MENEIKTIDDLAALIRRTMASKEDISEMKENISEMKEDIRGLRSEMKSGFERIENLLLAEQKREIEELKQRMKRLEDALAI